MCHPMPGKGIFAGHRLRKQQKSRKHRSRKMYRMRKMYPVLPLRCACFKGEMMENSDGKEQLEFWKKRAQNFPRYENVPGNYELGILGRMKGMGVDFRGKTVIDAGCGTGMYTLHIAQEAKSVEGVDISEDMLHFLRVDAEANGIKNLSVVCSDWNDYTPSKQFDIAFCTMSPALRTSEARKKLHDCASETVVYMGFDGLRESNVLEHFYPIFNITPKSFSDAHKMRAWLEENGISYKCETVEGEWVSQKTQDELTESTLNALRLDAPDVDEETVRRNLEKFRSENGLYTETVRYRSAIIVWRKD